MANSPFASIGRIASGCTSNAGRKIEAEQLLSENVLGLLASWNVSGDASWLSSSSCQRQIDVCQKKFFIRFIKKVAMNSREQFLGNFLPGNCRIVRNCRFRSRHTASGRMSRQLGRMLRSENDSFWTKVEINFSKERRKLVFFLILFYHFLKIKMLLFNILNLRLLDDYGKLSFALFNSQLSWNSRSNSWKTLTPGLAMRGVLSLGTWLYFKREKSCTITPVINGVLCSKKKTLQNIQTARRSQMIAIKLLTTLRMLRMIRNRFRLVCVLFEFREPSFAFKSLFSSF